MALKENNSNEEPIIGAVAIQLVLAMATCLPTIAYRIMMERLIKQPPTLWPHNGPTNPQSHYCDHLGTGSDQDKGVAVAAVAEGISSFEVAIPGSWYSISRASEQDTASNRSEGFRRWHSGVVN